MAVSEPDLVIPLIIDGKEENGSSTFDVVSATTGEVCWKAASASSEDAIRAVEIAKKAFPSWSKVKPSEKQKLLFKAADLLESRITEYGNIMQTEMGGAVGPVQGWILPTAVSLLRDIASHIPLVTGSVPRVAGEGQSAMIWKEPYGVILGIAPFNAPFALGMRAAATAIATGNTTVLKGSELTPRCYWALGRVFHDAGLPAGVLNIIYVKSTDGAMVTNAIIRHPAVRKINFTGSTEVGSKIARTCGENLKPCLMELGGKNSAIVCADADLQKAAMECILGGVLHSGQICMSTDRIIIHADIADKFLEILKATFSAIASSAPDPPLVVNAAAKARLQEVVSKAFSEGASSLIGGTEELQPKESHGPSPVIFTPMIIGDIKEDMPLWRDENFGPVVAYRIVKSDEEAIEMANDTEYGLSAAVFTQDLRKGFAIAKQLESGAVHINSMSVRDEPALPMGGVKKSGWGRFNTVLGMEEFLITKSVTWDD
ncbi:hypothetical protein SS1G_01166 [Sclerotinia sclerotiorum 1980 UF-70]|uniref:Aldehyde dehydrogenase domain-containing protein n=2 Tax=Sclerotinia sclerotiorum (strain ATCC 18683 / 1980 / Ss-1) TaxID=665079 RepID=A7E789_SCLS1|nr:hypothetical protein SS1G_01166 [Sclerotinia sclerotiorum 1980 UF-70]APA06321.1 hypothetical protein sscle_01g010910 [Sclerotinia sclerotiorum 1980 UF-70]EDN96241.1 hypothetical protein SS1G_01166 [Sclerotinia sclerotiorum 1980 UF-70]